MILDLMYYFIKCNIWNSLGIVLLIQFFPVYEPYTVASLHVSYFFVLKLDI